MANRRRFTVEPLSPHEGKKLRRGMMDDPTPPAGTRTAGLISRLLSRLAGNPERKLREESLPATPERLANVLVRQFETAFLAIPAAACVAGAEPAVLLRRTADELRDEGGFATRIRFL